MNKLEAEELASIQGGQIELVACYVGVGAAVTAAGAATGGAAWLGVGAALAGCAAAAA